MAIANGDRTRCRHVASGSSSQCRSGGTRLADLYRVAWATASCAPTPGRPPFCRRGGACEEPASRDERSANASIGAQRERAAVPHHELRTHVLREHSLGVCAPAPMRYAASSPPVPWPGVTTGARVPVRTAGR